MDRTKQLYDLIRSRCGDNPIDAEWGDIYPDLCKHITKIGRDLSPHLKSHQLLVVTAAVHYVRESFQSEGAFWQGFIEDLGRVHSQSVLFEAIYQWMLRQGIKVHRSKKGRREVVKTLLDLTGVPTHWIRDFSDFFVWYFRNHREQDAATAWDKYPRRRELQSQASFFIPNADKLRAVLEYLTDEGIDPDSSQSEVYERVCEVLGPTYDPHRLVRRRDSFIRLWKAVLDRFTPAQFKKWLRRQPSLWLTTPKGTVSAARKILMSDQIEYGTYAYGERRIDVVPHPKVSLESVLDWPSEAPWLGITGFVGFRSSHPFRIHNGRRYESSRPFTIGRVRGHLAFVRVPLGKGVQLPTGQVIQGRSGVEWQTPSLWLDRRIESVDLYVGVPHFLVAIPDKPNRVLSLEVRFNGTLISETYHRLDYNGLVEFAGTRVLLPSPLPGTVSCRMTLDGSVVEEKSIELKPALLFSPSGDPVRPTRQPVEFGGRKYILLLADGMTPTYYSGFVELGWTDTKCGEYAVAEVQWCAGSFYLSVGDLCWRFEQGFEVDLWVQHNSPARASNQQVFLELPSNAVYSLEEMQLHVSTSGDIPDEELQLQIFENNIPLDSVSISQGDLVQSAESVGGRIDWVLAEDLMSYLQQIIREPNIYDLAITLSNNVVARHRFYLVPQVRFPKTLPPLREGSYHIVHVSTDGSWLLNQDGEAVPSVSVRIPYTAHQVRNPNTPIHCFSEVFETSVSFARPPITATLRAVPVVCGVRTIIRRLQGHAQVWGLEARPQFSDIPHLGICVFGPANAVVQLLVNNAQAAQLQLDNQGQGVLTDLSFLSAHCSRSVNTVSVHMENVHVGFSISRHPQFDTLTYTDSVEPGGTFDCSLRVTGPAGLKASLRLSSANTDILLQETTLDGSLDWRLMKSSLPANALATANRWRLALVTSAGEEFLGDVWYTGLITGGIGEEGDVPALDLPNRARAAALKWFFRNDDSPLLIWCPAASVREKCVASISTAFRNIELYSPGAEGRGLSITEDLIYPEEVAAVGGVGIPENMDVTEALRVLAQEVRKYSGIVLVREAHLLSTLEILVLKQLARRKILVSARKMRLQ